MYYRGTTTLTTTKRIEGKNNTKNLTRDDVETEKACVFELIDAKQNLS